MFISIRFLLNWQDGWLDLSEIKIPVSVSISALSEYKPNMRLPYFEDDYMLYGASWLIYKDNDVKVKSCVGFKVTILVLYKLDNNLTLIVYLFTFYEEEKF